MTWVAARGQFKPMLWLRLDFNSFNSESVVDWAVSKVGLKICMAGDRRVCNTCVCASWPHSRVHLYGIHLQNREREVVKTKQQIHAGVAIWLTEEEVSYLAEIRKFFYQHATNQRPLVTHTSFMGCQD